MPRWTPPSIAPSSETSASCKKQAAASAVVPDAALKEGLSSEAPGHPSGVPEPAAGTPDGGSESKTSGLRGVVSTLLTLLSLFPEDV